MTVHRLIAFSKFPGEQYLSCANRITNKHTSAETFQLINDDLKGTCYSCPEEFLLIYMYMHGVSNLDSCSLGS